MAQEFLLNDDLLWDYADGLLSPEQRVQVDALLPQHPEAQARLEAIMAEMRQIKAAPMLKPDAGFADRVMASWVGERTLGRSPAKGNDWIVWGISLVFGTVVLFVLVTAIASFIVYGAPQMPESVDFPQAAAFDWADTLSHPLFRYGSMLFVAVLFLRLLDMYLQRKQELSV